MRTARDEDAEYVRAARRSRPRTKVRPAHEDAVLARVVAIDRGRYSCLLDDGTMVVAAKARELGRRAVVVGDRARLVGDVTGDQGSLARIVGVLDRTTTLRRTADDIDPVERVIVANADQMGIVVALADPPPRSRLIDRCLVAAYDGGLDPLLVLTKPDLAAPDDLLAEYEPLGVNSVVAARGSDLAALRAVLRDRVSVLIGHSGVGKSTLVNALVPGAGRSVGRVNVVTGRGRHTSTSAIALSLPDGGWIIDTPGIRSFGLAHVDPAHVLAAFEDLEQISADCPRGCPHTTGAPECALDTAVEAGDVTAARVASFRRLLDARLTTDEG